MLRTTILSAWLSVLPLAWGQSPNPPRVVLGVQSGSYLGVGVIEVNAASAQRAGLPDVLGVEVANVAPGSPAEQAGLRRGDIVTKFRGEILLGVEHFVRLVRETPVGGEVEMEVAAQGGRRTVSARIGERRPGFARAPAGDVHMLLSEPVDVDIPRPTMLVSSRSLGATLESIGGAFAQFFGAAEGVLVREVDPNGPAQRAGLQPGDVITAIEGSPVRRTSDIRIELGRAAGETARLDVMRLKARRQLQIETGRRTVTQPFEGARQVSRPNR